jgi:uncharacterized protein
VTLELETPQLVIGLLAAFVFGVAKTGVPSVGAFGVALLATVIPPVPSTGVALPLLLVGDVVAIMLYHQHALVGVLLRLLPSVLVGLIVGFILLRTVDTDILARLIGLVLILSALGELYRRRTMATEPVAGHAHSPVATLLGAGAGASTMVANAGGPMMTLYLLRMHVTTMGFMGTVAWFFFAVNVLKLPLSVNLGLVTAQTLRFDLMLLPGLALGAFLGFRFVRAASRRAFEIVALTATMLAGAWLVVAS